MKRTITLCLLLCLFTALISCADASDKNTSKTPINTAEKSETSETVADDYSTAASAELPSQSSELPQEEEPAGSEGLEYTLNESGTAYIVSGIGTCTDTAISIPSQHEGKPVVSVGESAFNTLGITSVRIPKSVNKIPGYAFAFCTNLESITVSAQNQVYHSSGNCLIETQSKTLISGCNNSVIPDNGSVTAIGEYAFAGRARINKLSIPDCIVFIGYSAFALCMNLEYNSYDNAKYLGNNEHPYLVLVEAASLDIESVNIHEQTRFIYDGAFYERDKLKNVTIPDSVTEIGKYAFYDCAKLETVLIGNGVRVIGEDAFHGDKSLTSLTFGGGITEIGTASFKGCSELKSVVIPDSVIKIGIYAFSDCWNLESLTLSSGLTAIEDGVFDSCSSLKSVVIPDGVTSIGQFAFASCRNMTAVTIPDSVAEVGLGAFNYCSKLACSAYENALYLGNADHPYLLLYKAVNEYVLSAVVHPQTKFIHSSAFLDCSYLKSVSIPDSVIFINDSAFYRCTGLTTVNYAGSNEQWSKIMIGYQNDPLLNAEIVFNSVSG